MIFNNQLTPTNLLGTCYVSGNIAFTQDLLYTPLFNVVKLIDLNNNHTTILPFETHNQIKSLTVSPDGVLLVAIDMAGYAIVFNLKGNFVVSQFNFKGTVNYSEFSSDGKLFAIAQNHGYLVYESPPHWRTFEPFVLLKKYKNRHSSDITNLKFSPDSRFIVTCGNDNTIYVNNLFPISDYLPITLEVHRYKIVGVYFSESMEYMYSMDAGSNIFVWKWTTELTQKYSRYRASKMRILSNMKGKTKVEIKNQEEDEEAEERKESHEYYSEFEKGVNNGRYILKQKLVVTQPSAYLKRVHFNVKNGFLVTAFSNGAFNVYKLIGEELNLIQSFSIGAHKVSTLAVNSSCTWIALGIKQLGQVIVWEWKSQSYILSQKGYIQNIQGLSCNSGKLIATGTTQGEVKLWEQSSGFCVATFKEHESAVTDIKFSNSNTLFSCSLDGTVNAYDTIKYKQFRKYKTDKHCQLNCLIIDESGQIVFAGAFDPYQVFAWNVKTANILQIVRGHEGPISCLQIGGDHLITGSWDRSIKVHEIYSRRLNVETLDHSSQITSMALHPNKKQIAVATIKGEIYIWQLENSQLLGIINSEMEGGRSYFSKVSAQNNTNTKYIKALVYSSCGNYLIGGGKSKYLMVYDVQHRMLFKKIQITRNRDLQGVMQKLNSKFIKQGNSTYEMVLQEQEKGLSDEEDTGLKLPGSKKMDVSEIRRKLQIEIKKIVILSNSSFAINTSFGVLIYSTKHQTKVFNPYELLPNITPQTVIELLKNKQYSSMMIAALQLNLPIKPLVKKIPLGSMKQTISQIDDTMLSRLLEKLSERSVDEREAIWVEGILSRQKVEIPKNLRLSFENMNQQIELLNRARAMSEMSELMNLQN